VCLTYGADFYRFQVVKNKPTFASRVLCENGLTGLYRAYLLYQTPQLGSPRLLFLGRIAGMAYVRPISSDVADIPWFVCQYFAYGTRMGGSVAEWLACWTQAQKGLGSNRSRDAVG